LEGLNWSENIGRATLGKNIDVDNRRAACEALKQVVHIALGFKGLKCSAISPRAVFQHFNDYLTSDQDVGVIHRSASYAEGRRMKLKVPNIKSCPSLPLKITCYRRRRHHHHHHHQITVSMKLSSFWEAAGRSTTQKNSLTIYGTRRFITVFARVTHWFLPRADQSSPYHSNLFHQRLGYVT
jgi:hypothetical protein